MHPATHWVLGAGFIGAQYAQQASQLKENVIAIRRSKEEPSSDSTVHLRWLSRDLFETDALSDLPNPQKILIAVSPSERSQSAYHRAFVTLSEIVLKEIERRSIKDASIKDCSIVLISSTAVYSEESGNIVDDTASAKASSETSAAIITGESLLLEQHKNATVLRCSGLYGPGRDRLIRQVLSGDYKIDPLHPRLMNRVHKEDVAAAALQCMNHPLSRAIICTDTESAPDHEVYQFLAQQLGVTLHSQANMGSEKTRANKRLIASFLKESGFIYRYPSYREGYSEMIRQGNYIA